MKDKTPKKQLIIESSEPSISSEKEDSQHSIASPINSISSTLPPTTSSSIPLSSINNSFSEDENLNNIDQIQNNLKDEYNKLDCIDEKYYSTDCNKFLLKKELLERKYLEEHSEENLYLYPNLNDKEFNVKIASKKEFNDTKYDGTIYNNIKEHADILAKADFELQPHQAFVKNFMSFQTPYSSLMLYHGLGSGKCHAKGTSIIMSDGNIKLIEDIKEGEFIMGDDSKPRKVLSLARGRDKMYDIIPIKGEKYTVNQEHILCLKASGFPKIYRCNDKYNSNYNIQWIEKNNFQSKTFTFNKVKNNENEIKIEAEKFYNNLINNNETNNNILEISVKDYLQLSTKKKNFLKGYKVPLDFTEKELPIDPYMIGYWLGDGTARESSISSQDSTVLYYFVKNLPKYNLTLNYRTNYVYEISGSGRVNGNLFLTTLKKLNMINNKHIPFIYKCNSRENRLKLLAGLLDSDGYLNKKNNGFEFSQKNEKLLEDVIYLVRSLGFSCYKSNKNTSWTYKGNKNYGNAFRINISGIGLEKIPTIIPRKIAEPRKQIKDVLVTGIKVKYVREDEYFGFTLDGNCRYLMNDFTVTHNTCSAIGVCEEMRNYMKQMGISKRIIIVASENVQDNFKLQLFDERKLKLIDGIWNIRGCVGNKLLKEINPTNMKGLPKEKVISQIKNLINNYYIFLGYGQFANYIIKTMNYNEEVQKQSFKKKIIDKEKKKQGEKTKIQMMKDIKLDLNSRIIKRLRNEFNNRLIVIDEVHNIRKTDDNENKKVAINLEILVKSALNMRLLLLSATPMYNTYKEIIWIINLMNTNDRRGRMEVKDVFDKNGNFKKNGEELLIRKATGYISFVRGENPYTFPYRIYPNEFAKENTFPLIEYPKYQMNLKKIKLEDKNRILSLYLTKISECNNCGKCQFCAYKYIIYNLRKKKFSITTKTGVERAMPSFENMESFGYTLLQIPLESLIISYPISGLKNILEEIPSENLSEENSPSFSEIQSIEESEIEKEESDIEKDESDLEKEESNETPIVIKNKPFILESSSSEITSEGGSDLKNSPKQNRYIDPNQLTGKLGLERMMNYIDNISPPKKGDFEYKKTTIENYGKIFSKNSIGNYSAKIKNILNSIVNEENGLVSEGILLIYSQYIDSGLIPMALALEEFGFTRYGQQGTKPLFKNKPTEVVDVRTMKDPKNKNDFIPARYAMITGDTRLSPNNDFEVKGLTGIDNKDGHKVKVVLISKAGSEGIDLKFIRQVHILDPWYNMNRIEQIIGRAVRNFSHKDLPFEKRNVEIFMYGTILGKNIEEAADLYVYRVAEYKAIQIGRVSRLLKQTSVDCIINHDQTNFTQKLMNENLKTIITQELSNGIILKDFKIGDAPYSPTCDYMADCNFNCIPNKNINEESLNEDTYNEEFIIMNSEKILQRIRMLMKESYFYKKDVLLKAIRNPKEYPYVQIYSALTQLIDDENEFIVDKYGRNGRLVNVGEYYLFQPLELRNKNASIFDRSVPIDYKHNMIQFEIKQNIVKPVIDKRNINKAVLFEEDLTFPDGKKIMEEMKVNFDIAREYSKLNKVPRGDDNWYKHCGIVIKKMSKEYPDLKNNNFLIQYLVAHMIELLLFEEKLNIMNYLYSLNSIKQGTVEWFSKEYFEMNCISTKNFMVFIMYKLNKRMIMILNDKNIWVEADPEDQKEIASSKETKEYLTMKINEYNKIVGFIGYEKSNRYLVFKTKDIESKRDTGARCDEAGKLKTLNKLNEIIGEKKFTNENTKIKKDENGNIINEAIGQTELCVWEEFILRYFNTIKRENKKYFFTPEMAIWHKLYTVFV